MSSLLGGTNTVSLVGNGPIARSQTHEIDSADLVIRFNYAPLCGAAGKRTDVLVLNTWNNRGSRARKGRPINPLARKAMREAWVKDEEEQSAIQQLHGVSAVLIGGGPADRVTEALAAHGARATTIIPSMGALALGYLIDHSDAKIRLYGFTHEGWKGHQWEAERVWIDSLITAGRVERHVPERPYVRPALVPWAQTQAIRLINHIRDLQFL
jgi:hypothetical protein